MSFKGLNFNFIIAAVTIAVGLLVCMAVTTTLSAASYSPIASVTTAPAQQMIDPKWLIPEYLIMMTVQMNPSGYHNTQKFYPLVVRDDLRLSFLLHNM